MADERIAFAGDLTTDVLGKDLSFTTDMSSTMQKVTVTEVLHWLKGDLRQTTIRDQFRRAYTFGDDVEVRVWS